MSFSTFVNNFYAGCLPNAGFSYTIFPFETDQNTVPAGRGIFTLTTGVIPTRTFYIEWRNCLYATATTCVAGSDNNYEIVFQEGVSDFSIVYGTFGAPNNTRGTIGVQGSSPAFYTESQCNLGRPASSQQTYTLCLAGTPTPSPTPTPTPTPTLTPTPATVCTLVEGFDLITTLVPNGWGMRNNSSPVGSTGWFQGNSTMFPSQTGAGDSYIGANFNNTTGTNTISNWLLTPPVNLQNGAQFSFWTRTTTPGPTVFPDRLQVRMSTNGTSQNVGTLATDVGDFSTLLLDINPTYTTTGYPSVWTNFVVTLSGLDSPVTGRVAFRYFVENGGPTGANSDYIGIDTAIYDCNGNLPTPSPTASATPTATATLDGHRNNAGPDNTTPTPTSTPPCASPTKIFNENFDGVTVPALPAGWVAANAVGTDGILWVTSNAGVPAPVADSLPNAAFINDPSTVHDKRLDSPSIPIAGPAQLSFRNNYNLEAIPPGYYDGGVLEISIGGGGFTDIITAGGSFVSGGYNATISTSFSNPIGGQPGWSDTSSGFITTVVNLPAAAAGQSIKLRWRMGSDDSVSGEGWRIDNVSLLDCLPVPTPTPFASIDGNVTYCTNPALNPVPDALMTLTGTSGGTTTTNGSGFYSFPGLTSGGTYTVTPAKTALAPGAPNINTTDVIAVQRHFLQIGTLLTGCKLAAADVNGAGGVNTSDVIAVQRFFLALTTGIANVGKYRFNPVSRSYSPLVANQTGQNYDAIIFGDVATGYVHRPEGE